MERYDMMKLMAEAQEMWVDVDGGQHRVRIEQVDQIPPAYDGGPSRVTVGYTCFAGKVDGKDRWTGACTTVDLSEGDCPEDARILRGAVARSIRRSITGDMA